MAAAATFSCAFNVAACGNGHAHTWGEWTETSAPTCTEAGVETRVCADDAEHTEARAVEALGHSYTNGVCIRCGANGGENHTHAYASVLTAPTCSEEGYTTYTSFAANFT